MFTDQRAASRLTTGVISAGRVGAVLGAALARAGHQVIAASAPSAAAQARAARLIPTATLASPIEVARRAELVVLAVPDDQLAELVADLVVTEAIRPGQLIFHTSGAHGIGVLDRATQRGALPLALHPAMTFAGQPDDLAKLTGVSFGVTAPAALRPVAEALTLELGGEPEWIEEQDRPLYHAALAHGSNHLVTLVNEAMELLREAGVVRPEQMLAPLLTVTLDNALRLGDAALTGPVARGDAGTVAKHLDTLRERAPDAVATYLALARRTADRAIAGHQLPAKDAEPLLGVLAK